MWTHEIPRPLVVDIFTGLLGLSAVLTACAGLSASGFLVPAACLLFVAALVWSGRGKRLAVAIVIANLASGVVQDLVLAFGDDLGRTKLDISGVLLIVNLLCGGPLMSLLALPLLAALRWSKPLLSWFGHSVNASVGPAL